jgi:hypothetical protein
MHNTEEMVTNNTQEAANQSTLNTDTTYNSVNAASTDANTSAATTQTDLVTANLADNTYMSAATTQTALVAANLADNTYMSAATPSTVTPAEQQDVTSDPSTGVIDQIKKLELEEKFHDLINNPRYWELPSRIKKLADALVLPVYDDASMRMFYGYAFDDLVLAEYKKSKTEKRPTAEISEEQIMELAEYKYHQKYVVEPALKAERAAKRAALKNR